MALAWKAGFLARGSRVRISLPPPTHLDCFILYRGGHMKIIKYEHACLVVEEQEQRLVIDPGVDSVSYNDFANISAVILTHVHTDHFNPEKLTAIFQQNPNVKLFTVQAVADELKAPLV